MRLHSSHLADDALVPAEHCPRERGADGILVMDRIEGQVEEVERDRLEGEIQAELEHATLVAGGSPSRSDGDG